RELIERALLVARDARVRRVVAVGRLERRGTRAERAVHEALEHAGVQERVIQRVRGALALEHLERIAEGQLLTHAHRQLALALELLEDEEVIPARVVLHRGNAVAGRVRERELETAAPLRR